MNVVLAISCGVMSGVSVYGFVHTGSAVLAACAVVNGAMVLVNLAVYVTQRRAS